MDEASPDAATPDEFDAPPNAATPDELAPDVVAARANATPNELTVAELAPNEAGLDDAMDDAVPNAEVVS